MRAAAEPEPVARDEAVDAVGEQPREGQREKASQRAPSRKDFHEALGRGRAAPRLVAGTDELHGLAVRIFRDPREAIAEAAALERDELDRSAPVPRGDEVRRPDAEPAVSVVDERVCARAHPVSYTHLTLPT